ncbi:MAG TPA: ribonuclease Z [Oscillatoriaceae cyanobacterium]
MELEIVFLGTSGAVPTPERGLSATLLKRGGDRMLIDCGEGTQRQLMRAGVGMNQIGTVLLTHLHADHYLGLPGMLKTWDLWGREAPVEIYGPKGLEAMVGLFKRIVGHTDYVVSYHEIPADTRIPRDGYHLQSLKTEHRVSSIGYALVEAPRPGRFDAQKAIALGLKPGPDFGRLQRGETIDGVTPGMVMGAGRAGRKIVVTGDTRPCRAVAEAAHGADVLVHDSTFSTEAAERALETYHSTAREAAELAKAADVRLLALTHLSFRHSPRELLAEAREVLPNVVLPNDLDRIEVPFEERGGPVYVDRRAERAAQRSQGMS